MSGYHCQAKIVSRGKGQSAIAKAAYNGRDRLVDEKTGELKDYSRGRHLDAKTQETMRYNRTDVEILFAGVFAPKDAPDWAKYDPAKFETKGQQTAHLRRVRQCAWNHAESAENRKDSQLAREIEVALPHQLSQEQKEWLLKDFVREQFTRKGLFADVNMHAPSKDGDERNIHAHILLSTRRLQADGFSEEKATEFNTRAALAAIKKDWAEKGARALERAGFEVEAERWRYGYMTNDQQREKALERGDWDYAELKAQEPSKHRGPQLSAMEARGLVSEVQERRTNGRAFEAANENVYPPELSELRAELAALGKEEAALLRDVRQENARHENRPENDWDQARARDRTDSDAADRTGDDGPTLGDIAAGARAIAGEGFVMLVKTLEIGAKMV